MNLKTALDRLSDRTLYGILTVGVTALVLAFFLDVLLQLGVNPIDVAEAGLNWIAQAIVAVWGFVVDQVTSL
jgi:hypothetical protein